MQTRIVLLAALSALAGCKSTDCGDGTTEQDGTCLPANVAYGSATCGPFTELHGTQCVPMFPPTMCGDGTEADTDSKGVTTCIGTGAATGCSAKIACPAPTDGKQTICGQLYDFETGAAFAAAGATGAQCTASTTTGPCAIGIHAFDALAFLGAPTTTAPLATGSIYIDDCGRYKIPEITQPSTPFIALAFDDAESTNKGPAGVTNATGVATAAGANTATKDLEAFIVKASTSGGWGIDYSTMGIYAAVFRGHSTGTDPAVGVSLLYGSTTGTIGAASNVKYFQAGSTNRTTIDSGANSTTTNGTALFLAPVGAGYYTGMSTLPATCAWPVVPGGSVPGAIFVQIFRPMNAPGQTCTL